VPNNGFGNMGGEAISGLAAKSQCPALPQWLGGFFMIA
jgi:hypothetical protein